MYSLEVKQVHSSVSSGFSDNRIRVNIVLNDSMSFDKKPHIKVECFCTFVANCHSGGEAKVISVSPTCSQSVFFQRLLIYSSVLALVAQSGLMLSKKGAKGK